MFRYLWNYVLMDCEMSCVCVCERARSTHKLTITFSVQFLSFWCIQIKHEIDAFKCIIIRNLLNRSFAVEWMRMRWTFPCYAHAIEINIIMYYVVLFRVISILFFSPVVTRWWSEILRLIAHASCSINISIFIDTHLIITNDWFQYCWHRWSHGDIVICVRTETSIHRFDVKYP